ncbi:hypothetical protein PKF05_09545 [Fusobacterium simiae]|uniref:major outer membrane protein FomA n=1 Tax=Fusobacterium TaxID=848 RepID=UPI000421E44D|nr:MULTISPECIES: hypothetical protein [Fusobacterium]MDC7956070.1 hypothetical protein [Fusobacterium simiae]
MKKIALVLGSLLVVGAVASAKEVMPAPEATPEKVVEYVEKPVIVYRDREVAPAWKPNGSFDIKETWYGEAENKTPGEDTDKDWARGRTNAGRLQMLLNLNFTQKQSLQIRSRTYQTFRSTDSGKSGKSADHLRFRYHYDFGKLGTSKVNAKSRLEYSQSNGDEGTKQVKASVLFDITDYFPSSDYFKVESFGFRPGYTHRWTGHGSGVEGQSFSSGTANRYTLDFESTYKLPWGFSAELNLYSGYDRHNKRFAVGTNGDTKKGQFYGYMEAYLYQHTPLYKINNVEFAFDFEGGYDTYEFRQYKVIANHEGRRTDRRSYSLYMTPYLSVSYKPTDFVKLYVAAGAEYRNWAVEAESEAKNWRWQPTAWAGMKVTF